MRKWLPMLILSSAQFVMVLDSSVMNVAISQIVADLDTTIQGVQTAITLYTLVMAAFMLLGAKLGDIMGRNRAFAADAGDIAAQIGRPAVDELLAAHRLWVEWLDEGRVRKLALVAETAPRALRAAELGSVAP